MPAQKGAWTHTVILSPELVRLGSLVYLQITVQGGLAPRLPVEQSRFVKGRSVYSATTRLFLQLPSSTTYFAPLAGIHHICTGEVVRVRNWLCRKEQSCLLGPP